jgi:hypothetical protein
MFKPFYFSKTLVYLSFKYILVLSVTLLGLFQKRVVCTKLNIYVVISHIDIKTWNCWIFNKMQHLHDLIISLKGEFWVWAHKTWKTPPLYMEVVVPIKDTERSTIRVLGTIRVLSIFYCLIRNNWIGHKFHNLETSSPRGC